MAGRASAVAVASLAKPVIITVPHDERIETFLDVYKKNGAKKRLVCSIEILSLTNKTPGEKGRKLYRRKQQEILSLFGKIDYQRSYDYKRERKAKRV